MAKKKTVEATENSVTLEVQSQPAAPSVTLDDYVEKLIEKKASEVLKLMKESSKEARNLVAKAEEDASRNQKALEEDLARAAKLAVANAISASKQEAEEYYGRTLKEYEKARALVRETMAEAEAKKKEIQDIIVQNAHLDECGCTTMDGTGKCYVYLSKEFVSAAGGRPYQVFLQEEAEGQLWVSKKSDACFVVEGTAGVPFSWNARVSILG